MEGPDKPAAPYHIRSHREDDKGVSLQVRIPVGQKISMARLIGTDIMLFSTGDAIDSPFVERGRRAIPRSWSPDPRCRHAARNN